MTVAIQAASESPSHEPSRTRRIATYRRVNDVLNEPHAGAVERGSPGGCVFRDLTENSMIKILRLCALIALASAAGCGKPEAPIAVEESTHVTAAQQNGDFATVNGAISIDDNAKLGTAKTVNGDIYLGLHATAGSLATVNGGITIDKGGLVSGEITSVNGTISLLDGSEVSGSLTNVNGRIIVTNAHVSGGITTIGGDVNVMGTSRIDTGIWMKNLNLGVLPAGDRIPRVVIGPGAVIHGEMRFEHKVKLFVSDKATIGAVNGAEPVRFSGDAPPP